MVVSQSSVCGIAPLKYGKLKGEPTGKEPVIQYRIGDGSYVS